MLTCPFCGKLPKITQSSDIVTYATDESKPRIFHSDGSWTQPMKEINRQQSWHLECPGHVTMFGNSRDAVIKKFNTRVIA